jgi:hypothetical protein
MKKFEEEKKEIEIPPEVIEEQIKLPNILNENQYI